MEKTTMIEKKQRAKSYPKISLKNFWLRRFIYEKRDFENFSKKKTLKNLLKDWLKERKIKSHILVFEIEYDKKEYYNLIDFFLKRKNMKLIPSNKKNENDRT